MDGYIIPNIENSVNRKTKKTTNNIVRAKISYFLTMNGWRIADLASRSGISERTLYNKQKGDSVYTLADIDLICAAFRISPATLIER